MEIAIKAKPIIELGTILLTPGANAVLTDEDIDKAIALHKSGDWGMLCPNDWQINDEAAKTGGGILSVYRSSKDVEFIVMTEPGWKFTTVLLPSEY
jgi:hypothetical protein